MINSMQRAIIKKDIRSVTANKNLLLPILIIPIVMAIILPSLLIMGISLTPLDSPNFQEFLPLLTGQTSDSDLRHTLISVVMNDVIPLFFLMIPIITSMVMAASSFVGEKEKRTLETLFYCPLSLKEIFNAKVFSAFAFSQLVALCSFIIMVILVQIELWFLTHSLMLPGLNWAVLLLLVSPAISLITITLIVKGSAKAKSVEESQQRSAFIVLPIIFLAASQLSGLFLINSWILLGLGGLCAIGAALLLRGSAAKFNYETLIQ